MPYPEGFAPAVSIRGVSSAAPLMRPPKEREAHHWERSCCIPRHTMAVRCTIRNTPLYKRAVQSWLVLCARVPWSWDVSRLGYVPGLWRNAASGWGLMIKDQSDEGGTRRGGWLGGPRSLPARGDVYATNSPPQTDPTCKDEHQPGGGELGLDRDFASLQERRYGRYGGAWMPAGL